MTPELINLLRCPETGQPLHLEPNEWRDERIYSGWLISDGNGQRYPIKEFIPRFVPAENYADSFGMQWILFRQTQLDSHSGHPISAERFWRTTGWKREDLRGQWVLDVGCGAGRFAEVALEAGAKVVALDYSNAVKACYENFLYHPNLHLIQGDIYHLPLRTGFFPFIYALSVLQHTPDVARAFASLPPMLRRGGRLAVDVYPRQFSTLLMPKYWFRPVVKRIPKEHLFRFLKQAVPIMFKISCWLQNVPVVGSTLKKMVPVANYTGVLPLTSEQHLEWALLDTFDMFSPEYDQPQSPTTLRSWLQSANLVDIEVEKVGLLVGRGHLPV